VLQLIYIAADCPDSAGASAARLADQIALLPNYPNPFNPTTFIVLICGRNAVDLAIYNISGQRIRTCSSAMSRRPTSSDGTPQ
jgi:hypothetical protein